MISNSLIAAASFAPRSLQSPNAWVGHLPFAAWVIQEVSPKIFVELGTHSGNSYFSFCQSAAEAGLSSKCYAVDTWQGDEHAGQYDDEIFAKVNAHHQEYYSGFSRLLRNTFDDAVTYFADDSIELLHIDGLHTYEAVRHDFETWLPKLAPGAVVMFHDTNVRERNFGVWKLWEELQADFPNNLEFVHSHGLGVLQLNNAPDNKKLEWLQPSSPEKQRLIDYFASIGSRQLERFELNELKQHAGNLRQVMAERDVQVYNLNNALVEREEQITNLTQTLAERDGQGTYLNLALADRDGQIAALYNSTSWQITWPLRIVAHQMKRVRRVAESAIPAIKHGGGLKNTFKKAIQLYRREGLAGIRRGFRIVATAGQIIPTVGSSEYDENFYAEWIGRHDTLSDEARSIMRARIDGFALKPLISVVMPTYNAKPEWLIEAIESVRKQIYPHWELCIADDASTDKTIRPILERYAREDARIKVAFREQNGHISAASNTALQLANGNWVGLLDHDDLLNEHALFWVADAINKNPDVGMIYSDEDKISQDGRRCLPFFKPDWSPHLACSQAFVGHFLCLNKDKLGHRIHFDEKMNGAQDYDLWLRCASDSSQIVHISKVLYHWRMHQNSTALNAESKLYADAAGRNAVKKFIQNRYPTNNIAVECGVNLFTYRLVLTPSNETLVSIIIPTKDKIDLLSACIESIINKSKWKNFEIIVLDNCSTEKESLDYFEKIVQADIRIKVIKADFPFNWSCLNNFGVNHASGTVFVFLNNDTEVITDGWLHSLIGYALLPDVGVVGGLLLFEDGMIQHSGVVVGMGGWADHVNRMQAPIHSGLGPFVSPMLTRDVLAVTGACMAISRDKYERLGGFDESFIICGSDVELCLRAWKNGLYNVMCAEARLFHHESKTRTPHVPQEDFIQSNLKYAPYRKELSDPFYNKNLSFDSTMPEISSEPRDA